MKIYDASVKTIRGETTTLQPFQGKTLLIVNVASECGLTPQYKGLEALYQKFKGRGLEILGFPCNQFGAQEPGTETQIQNFCEKNYGVTFPLFAKIEVNGPGTHPLYKELKQDGPDIKWNFEKFLISRDGQILKRFAPTDTPEAITKDIENAL